MVYGGGIACDRAPLYSGIGHTKYALHSDRQIQRAMR